MILSRNAYLTDKTHIKASHEVTLGPNQCSGFVPPVFILLLMHPLLHSLSYSSPQHWNYEKNTIFGPVINIWRGLQRPASPFCIPFFQIRKVQKVLYILNTHHVPPKWFALDVHILFLKTNLDPVLCLGWVLVRTHTGKIFHWTLKTK